MTERPDPAEPKPTLAPHQAYGDLALHYPLFLPWAWFLLRQPGPAPAQPASASVPAPQATRPTLPPPPRPDAAPRPEPGPEPSTCPDLVVIDNLIKDYVILSMALGLVPAPLVDVAAMAGVQVKMAHALTHRYGIPFSRHRAQAIATSLAGSVLPVTTGLGVASLFKVVPGIGSLVGGATVSILSGAITYATGRLLAQHFESGGTLLSFDPVQARSRFHTEVRHGQALARRLHRSPADPD